MSTERTHRHRSRMLLPVPRDPLTRFDSRISRLAIVMVSSWMLGCAPKEASAPTTAAEPVTFVKQPPPVGRVSVEDSSIELELEGEAQAAERGFSPFRSQTIERERRRDVVLAVFARIVTKKKITFEKLEREERRNGTPVAQQPSPLLGRTYVVELKQSAPIFTGANGETLSDQEQRELVRRLASFGKLDPFLEGIPDGPIHPGREAPGLGGGILELFERADDGRSTEANAERRPDVGKVDVHFAGARDRPEGRCGVFVFQLKVQLAGEPRFYLDLEGEFLVRISDSAPIELDIRGPLRMADIEKVEGIDVRMTGTGSVRGSFSIHYL